jgi:ferredoxin
MVSIPVSSLQDLFSAIACSNPLYVPVENGSGQTEYRPWKTGMEMSARLNTDRSAKDFFFPQTENIVDFKLKGKNLEVLESRDEREDFVVFGVRACDAASFDILDRVFLSQPVDTFYKSRREHGIVVSIACSKPDSTCFCPLFGIDATNPAGDVAGWIADGSLHLEAQSGKGEALLESVKEFTHISGSAESASVDRQKTETRAILGKLPFAKLRKDKFTGENLNELFNSEKWASLSASCLGCGTCTFVCPTCQCYDIRDFDTGHGIKRFRCWDSCMFSDFTRMAHGNPRLTQVERFRQRFMHKLVYAPANNGGVHSCVGCGRCLRKCPVNMHIVKVIKALGEEQ